MSRNEALELVLSEIKALKKQQQKQVQDLPTHLRNILGHKFHSNIFSYYSLNGSQSQRVIYSQKPKVFLI